MATLDSELDAVVTTVRDRVLAALTATDAGAPQRVCEVAGALAWDACDCGLLAVTVDRIVQSRAFPADAPPVDMSAGCPPPYLAASLTVTVLRCAPPPDRVGNPPTCEALDLAAQVWVTDLDATRRAIACALADLRTAGTIEEYTLGDQTPAGPEGGCVGFDTHLTVGLVNCLCPAG